MGSTTSASCEDNDFQEYKISCKASDVFLAAAAYQGSGRSDGCTYPFGHHRGRWFDLGHDQIRDWFGQSSCGWELVIRCACRLSADPVEEVKVGYEILKSLGLRHRGVNIISAVRPVRGKALT